MTNGRVTLLLAAAAAAATLGCGRLPGTGPAVSSEDDKTLYALGLIIGRNVGGFDLTPAELEVVKAGLTDAVLKRPHRVDLATYGGKVDALSRRRAQAHVVIEKARAKTFLEGAAREPGAVRTDSGLIIRTVKPGTGDVPKPSDRVKVHYEGHLTDGTVFDSSRQRGQPATFPLTGVIKCWTEGLGRMKVGEQAVLTCPSEIAYGDVGRPPTIPGGATLVFDVELLAIQPPSGMPGAPPAPAFGHGPPRAPGH